MSTPLEQLQPPPTGATQQANTDNTSHGSVGPVIAVLAVITILGVIAGMIGRLCSGRPIMGHGHYDFEGWVERKCSSCIDGSMDPPPPRPATVPAEETQQEIIEEEEH
ncbi:Peptidyl-prolyl cis-trans isomerase / cyclophilin-40 (CYP40) / rotamase isoform 1 [Hibiscus syriacus]|uniref:Peptidyl-prolyl cis-trans isomerase / cyclophilin-40 (CYP40) / rotamase isoform 1 n=1 Tax=Hibiscus syriacus TaxID=106335 RepID=A0A6A3A4S1_HIBSY|nr:uncharacterized protein LOC120133892 [Hibiscus syriacus]KAE8698637.1 Peptidyl-prolyl cis-trans isomerase / cyclophilin-40 (CYP40) / rotamase isoform 1 [Hibiscus syriacus]